MYRYITLIAFLAGLYEARLVFPPGSDVGYIVSDDPEKQLEDTFGVNDLDIADQYAERLLQRGERAAVDAVESALLRTIANRVARGENSASVPPKTTEDPVGKWLGKWFPHPPQIQQRNRMDVQPVDLPDSMKDDTHGVKMGVSHVKCDNGKLNLTMDWDGSPVNYTCFDPKNHRLPVQEELKSETQCVEIPPHYMPQHYCMNTQISYNSSLPLYGPHRPLWPTYGEYVFAPPQRWLHTLEHGGVVMLYHPCAEPLVVDRLRKVLTSCYRKYVITPYTHLSVDRPLALVAWGCSIEMATVDENEVKDFIKKRALKGPEGHMAKDGSYKIHLLRKSEYPPGSDGTDRDICPRG